MPERELEFWTSPMASRFHFATKSSRRPRSVRRARANRGTGQADRAYGRSQPASSAIDVGGHSPGQTILIVSTGQGEVVLTSDAIHFYEELELDRPFGVFADLREMYAGYDVLRDLESGGRVLVPGHDPEVMERFPGVDGPPSLAVQVA